MKNRIKIIQHNVRSWNTNKVALTNIYNQLDADVILLNETSITDCQTLKIFNYDTHYYNKNNRRNHGTAIAIKRPLKYRLHDDFESDMLAVTISTRESDITIATLYSPPSQDYLHFIDFNKLFNRPEPTYFLGDLNANHPYFGYTSYNTVGNNLRALIDANVCKHEGPYFPTLLRHNSTTSPDIVLTNNKTFHNLHLQPGPITPSDHIPVIAQITCEPITIPIKPRKSIAKANWTQYRTDLSSVQIPSDNQPTLEQIDEYLEEWTSAVINASDKNIPTINYRKIPGIQPNAETNRIQLEYDRALHHRELYGASLEIQRHIDFLKNDLRIEYQIQYNKVWNTLIEELDITDETKQFWKTIKRFQGNDKQKTKYIKDHNNKKLEDPQAKEEHFRNHWKKIFTEEDPEDSEFNYEAISETEELLFNIENTPFDFGDVTRLKPEFPLISLNELRSAVKSFKQKAPGPTGITAEQIKQLPMNMVKFLLYIYNQSISAGYFPDKLKHANMIFIPKGIASQHQVQNYRPISLLDVQGKILEKVLNRRLIKHFHKENLYNPRQHGFRQYRGTHTALATLFETLAATQAKGWCTDIILRDVAKAFDKVWLDGLKYKLSTLNIHPCFMKTLCDFISDRTASATVDGYTGPPFSLHSGVPQGSCLSPTLYSFYTHDIPEPLENTDYIAYADDITQITSGPYKYKSATQNTEHAIKQVNDFEAKWKIKTNARKFVVVPISRNKTQQIYIDDKLIDYSNRGKVLGLTIASKGILHQVPIRKAIANKNLTKIFRFRNLNIKNKLKLYKTLVRSTLIYPIIPLNTLRRTQMLQLQRVQNKAARFITDTKWFHFKTSKSLHEQLELDPINIVIHNQAKGLWNSMKTNTPELYNKLKTELPLDRPQHKHFKSSRLSAEGDTPQAIYV